MKERHGILFKRIRNYRAQSFSEYTVCVLGVTLAVIFMQAYVRRGMLGRYNDLVKHTAKTVTGSNQFQYEPYYTTRNYILSSKQTGQEISNEHGVRRIEIQEQRQSREGISSDGVNPYVDE